MKRLYWLPLIVFTTIVSGFNAGQLDLRIAVEPGANPWTHLKFNNDPNNFQFVIVSDRTGGRRPGVFANAVRKINLLQPEFVICVGDLIDGYTEDEAELERQWGEFGSLVKKLQMPFFYVPGNHDISNQLMLKEWKEQLGRPYYHFIYRDVLFLCLDTEGGNDAHKPAHLSHEQREYFRRILRDNPKVRWTLVFLHEPLWEYNNQSWLEFEKLLTGRDYTVFAGHKHQYALLFRRGQRYIRLATTGGGSSLDGPVVGSFDHVVWVTMSDQGPRVANLMLGGIRDENVTPYFIAAAAEFLKRKIDEGKVVECEPIISNDDTFSGGKTQMRITNYAILPMKVKGSFKECRHLRAIPHRIDETVFPLSKKVIHIEVIADQSPKMDQISPLEFEAQISYNVLKRPSPWAKARSRITVQKPTK